MRKIRGYYASKFDAGLSVRKIATSLRISSGSAGNAPFQRFGLRLGRHCYRMPNWSDACSRQHQQFPAINVRCLTGLGRMPSYAAPA
jgi:hypothetical protein